jgi:hypothetical protein
MLSLRDLLRGAVGQGGAYRKYGEPLNFKERVDLLERAAQSYFIRHCSQENEGTFFSLVCEVRYFQPRRNEITHSIVAWRSQGGANEYFLLPPDYFAKKFGNYPFRKL